MKNTLFAFALTIATLTTAAPALAYKDLPDGAYWQSLDRHQKIVAVDMSTMSFIGGEARAYAADNHPNGHFESFSRSVGYYIACLDEFYTRPHAMHVPIGVAFETLHDGATLGDQDHAIKDWGG